MTAMGHVCFQKRNRLESWRGGVDQGLYARMLRLMPQMRKGVVRAADVRRAGAPSICTPPCD
jgi:hypothetical protein